MNVEILTIGREILDGRVIDTNSVFLAETLKKRGLIPRFAQRVDDDMDRILEAFQIAAGRSQIILVTGGLGPTSDDITAEAFAKFLGEPLRENAEALLILKGRLDLLGRPLTDTQKKQARLAPSCFPLKNPEGTAPGFGFERSGPQPQRWFFMPGVPREMKPMMVNEVSPRLPEVKGYRTFTWATHFTAEASLQDQLRSIEGRLPAGFEVTYRTRFPENHVGLHGDCAGAERAARFEEFKRDISAALGDAVFSSGADRLPSLEEVTVKALAASKSCVATVESCTGGLVANRLTDIPGSSEVFCFGEVTYANAAKVALGVDGDLIKRHGAVSREVAVAMAEAGLRKLRASAPAHVNNIYCLATTGVAGPTGGTADKPVGLCQIALALPRGPTLFEEVRARPALDRQQIKSFFAQKALDLLRLHLAKSPTQKLG